MNIIIFKFIFIALLLMLLPVQVVYAQEIKPLCKCSWLAFIVNSNNTLSTSAHIKTFEQFKRSDEECEKINNLCDTRNKGVLEYISCTNQSLKKQKASECEDNLNKAEKDFTDQLNKILNKTSNNIQQEAKVN